MGLLTWDASVVGAHFRLLPLSSYRRLSHLNTNRHTTIKNTENSKNVENELKTSEFTICSCLSKAHLLEVRYATKACTLFFRPCRAAVSFGAAVQFCADDILAHDLHVERVNFLFGATLGVLHSGVLEIFATRQDLFQTSAIRLAKQVCGVAIHRRWCARTTLMRCDARRQLRFLFRMPL